MYFEGLLLFLVKFFLQINKDRKNNSQVRSLAQGKNDSVKDYFYTKNKIYLSKTMTDIRAHIYMYTNVHE